MPAIRHLENAPISFALIDLRASKPFLVDPNLFLEIQKKFKSKYPKQELLTTAQISFKFQSTSQPESRMESSGLSGVQLKSDDGRDVVQFRNDGFTFSRLKPYTSWEKIYAEVKILSEEYLNLFTDVEISRVATRYNNELIFPTTDFDTTKILTAPPILPAEIPRHVSSFISRFTLHDPDNDLASHLIFEMKPAIADEVKFIIDIDAFKQFNFGRDINLILSALDKLRDLKNKIFFGSLTEDTLRRYK